MRAKHLEHLDQEALSTVFDQGRMHQGYNVRMLLPAIRCLVLILRRVVLERRFVSLKQPERHHVRLQAG